MTPTVPEQPGSRTLARSICRRNVTRPLQGLQASAVPSGGDGAIADTPAEEHRPAARHLGCSDSRFPSSSCPLPLKRRRSAIASGILRIVAGTDLVAAGEVRDAMSPQPILAALREKDRVPVAVSPEELQSHHRRVVGLHGSLGLTDPFTLGVLHEAGQRTVEPVGDVLQPRMTEHVGTHPRDTHRRCTQQAYDDEDRDHGGPTYSNKT
jgi:hypothetical protein